MARVHCCQTEALTNIRKGMYHTTEADSLAEQALESPFATVAEQQELDVQNITSLTGVLKTLCESDSVEKQIPVTLALHKCLYHRKEEELVTLLTRAGIPSRHLTRIKEAVDRCEYSRRWSQSGQTFH